MYQQQQTCQTVETSNIGLIYLFLPVRFKNVDNWPPTKSTKHVGDKGAEHSTFRLNHYYSLLALAKIFKANANDRLLFYYVNEAGRPQSNHYNQWLNDTFWSSRIPLESIKMIKIDYEYDEFDFNLFDIIARIRVDCVKRFDSEKRRFLLVTSDVIIGPKIQSCFTLDLDESNRNGNSIDIENIRYAK